MGDCRLFFSHPTDPADGNCGANCMSPKEMREKKAELAKEIRQLADKANGENRDFTPEEQKNWDDVNDDYNGLNRNLERAERVEEMERELAAPVGDPDIGNHDFDSRNNTPDGTATDNVPDGRGDSPTEEDRSLALQAWFRCQVHADLTDRQVEACQRSGLNPNRPELKLALFEQQRWEGAQRAFSEAHPAKARRRALASLAESRDLSAVTGSTGGYLGPEGFISQLEINLLAFGGMLQVADVIRTSHGNDLPWPTADDTGNTGVLLGESASIGSSVDPSFGQKVYKAHKFSSRLVKIPSELFEDSAFDMASLIGAMLGERLGRVGNTQFTTGIGGGNAPRGITLDTTVGVTTASSTAITGDELIDLTDSVDPAYLGGAQFMLHHSVLKTVRQLKDGGGQYLWVSGLQQGLTDSLLGYPLTGNSDMASTLASGAISVLFGQLNKYKIRQVSGVRFRRLVERYADNDQEGFVAFLRQDGALLDAGTAPVKHIVQV